MEGTIVTAAVGAALFFAAVASGDVPPLSAGTFEVDQGLCFDRDALTARVQHWTTGPIDPRVRVRVTRSDSEISFTLVRDSSAVGQRMLSLPHAMCGDATDAVALAIALALDANQGEPAAPEGHEPDLEEIRPAEADRVLPPPRPASKHPVSVSAAALGSVGLLPQAAFGLAVGLDTRWTRAFETHVAVFGVTATSVPPYSANGSTLTTTLGAAIVDACAGASVRSMRLRTCAGGAFGAVLSNASEEGVQIPVIGWAGPTARVDGTLPLTRSVAVSASVDGFMALLRPDRTVESGGGYFPALAPLPAYGLGAAAGLAFDL